MCARAVGDSVRRAVCVCVCVCVCAKSESDGKQASAVSFVCGNVCVSNASRFCVLCVFDVCGYSWLHAWLSCVGFG